MLRAHLDELFGVVDVFVIAEATTSFQGKPKPLWFNLSKSQLSWLRPVLPIVRHVIVDDMPTCSSKDAWQCEYHQRNALRRGMTDVRPHDLVIVSDVDEIVRRSAAMRLKQCAIPTPLALETQFYYYSLRWKKRFAWNHPNVVLGRELARSTIEEIRQGARFDRSTTQWTHTSKAVLRNAGWHLSYFMTIEEIVGKLHSFSHTEYNEAREGRLSAWDDPDRIRGAICSGKDLFARNPRREDLDYTEATLDGPSLVVEYPSAFPRFHAYARGDSAEGVAPSCGVV